MTYIPKIKLSDKQVKEFNDIYEQNFGVRLSDFEAREQATKLVELYALICRPLPKKEKEQTGTEAP